MSQHSTSTPKKTRKPKTKSESSGGGGEESAVLLRSLLGVSPVSAAAGEQPPAPRRGRRPPVPEVPAGGVRLTLDEAIQRVAEPGARGRSFSASEGAAAPEAATPKAKPRPRGGQGEARGGQGEARGGQGEGRGGQGEGRASPGPPAGLQASGSPDAGYGTSLNTTGSPDGSLAELVRAMQLKAGEAGTRRRKLPSISEMDPAVTQAVRSPAPAPFYDHHQQHQFNQQGPNLLHTLFGYQAYPGPYYDPASYGYPPGPDPYALERAAKLYRSAASVSPASCTWSGQLPPPGRGPGPLVCSDKVFLGGVPWDLTEACIVQAFSQFGPVRIEWPGRGRQGEGGGAPKGYLYLVLEGEGAVAALLDTCTHDPAGGTWYYRLSSRRTRGKEVQVIPWMLSDSNFVRIPSQRLDPNKTVFVGALHGMLNAEGLAHIFSDLFGGVVYAGIDTDRHKYPIGSGRVTFSNTKSYMKAVSAAFIEIKTVKFTKKVQVDPYLEDALCSACLLKQGPYFCRDLACFNYFCRFCWELQHAAGLLHHKPIMRSSRGGAAVDRPVELDLHQANRF